MVMDMKQSTRLDSAGLAGNNQDSLPFLLALIAAGVAGNFLRFPIFFDLDFLFGSIFALLALQLFGLRRGVVAAVLISAYTILLWNHPYACLILTAEVAVVGWLFPRHKIGLVLADVLYWLGIGMPLVYLFYHGVMHVSWENTSIIMIKQAVNGIANALIARLLFAGYTLLSRSRFLPLREILSALLGFFVLFPALIFLAISSRADFASNDQRICTALLQDRDVMSERLKNWLSSRMASIVTLAQLATTLSPQEMQARLEQTLASDPNFLRVGLLDQGATTIAVAPRRDELGQATIGLNFADRPYLPLLKKNLQPMLSEVVVSRIGPPHPVAHLLAPVVKSSGYAGYIAGTLKLDRIEKILGVHAAREGQRFTLLDRNGNIITTNDQDQKAMTPVVRGPGKFYPREEGLAQWVPTLPASMPTSERWEKSYYRAEEHVSELAEWTLILEQPIAPLQKELYDTYTRKLALLFLILLGALLFAELLSRLITRSNEKLQAATADLPTKLAAGTPIAWPQSAILETKQLIENFRKMATALAAQFSAIRQINASLEEQIVKRTEELSESRERYDLALLGSQDGIWEWNFLTGKCYCSGRGFAMLGYTTSDLEHSFATFEDLLHPDDLETVRTQIRQHLEQRIPYSVEFRMRRKNGEYSWILARGQALWNEQGQAVRMAGSHTDISERKQLEKALRESNRLLKKTFASLHEAIFIVETATRRILDCNITTEKMFGYTRSELIGAHTSCLHLSEEMSQRFGSEMLQAYAERGFFETTFQMKRKDGSVFASEHSVTPIHDDQGAIVSHVCVVRDISERKKAEGQILSSLREKEILLKEIHHRVKNNLQVVYSLLALQASSIADPDIRILFDESRNRIGSMALIHEKIYSSEDLSHIDFGYYLQEMVQNIAGTYLRPEIKVVVAAEPIFLDINSGIPCGLIVNELVSNSYKYAFPAGKGGQITIAMNRAAGGRYLLTVADNGIGFSPDIDFRQTTSLGLQLVTVLAGQLQGEISLSTAAGTRFTISFPGKTP
jgi:PAS domain S-box-containing protein